MRISPLLTRAALLPTALGVATTAMLGLTTGVAHADSGGLAALRQCESSGNYATNTGNGFYGAYQFDLQTWQGLGYSGLPSNASPATQDQAVERLAAQRGTEPWPVCGRGLNLTGGYTAPATTPVYHPAVVQPVRVAATTLVPAVASAPVTVSASSNGYDGTVLTTQLLGQHRGDVKEIQAKLDQEGYSLAQDGQYGPLTRSATVSFQASHHVAADGEVGPITWGVLMG